METLKTFLRIPVGSVTPTHKIVVSRDYDGYEFAMDMDIVGTLFTNTIAPRKEEIPQKYDGYLRDNDALQLVCEHLGETWETEEWPYEREPTEQEMTAFIQKEGVMWDCLKVAGCSEGEYGHFLQILTKEDIQKEWNGDYDAAQAYIQAMRKHYTRAFNDEIFFIESETLIPISDEEGERHSDTVWHEEGAYAMQTGDSLSCCMLGCDEYKAKDEDWKTMLLDSGFCTDSDTLTED